MVVHYPRTVWKNRYAEHEVTGKTYNLKKRKKDVGLVLVADAGWGWIAPGIMIGSKRLRGNQVHIPAKTMLMVDRYEIESLN